jgi:hypothetical protein
MRQYLRNFGTIGLTTRTPDEMQVLVDSSVKTQVTDVKVRLIGDLSYHTLIAVGTHEAHLSK